MIAIDIGNTNVVIGFFNDKNFSCEFTFKQKIIEKNNVQINNFLTICKDILFFFLF